MRTTDQHQFAAKAAEAPRLGHPATRGPSTRPRLSVTVPALIIVLIFHAALLVAEVVDGPKWLAAAEGLLALLTGLFELRRLEDPE